jgi:NAD+ kinase
MTYHIYVNNKLTDSLRADGMIVSTPTGSTAYSLSAGGPILKPDSEMLLLTPVCPHTLYARPWVLSGRDEIKIQIEAVDGEEAAVYMDGEFAFHIGSGTCVNVRKSDFKATIIKTSDMDFFEVLRKKMGSVQ